MSAQYKCKQLAAIAVAILRLTVHNLCIYPKTANYAEPYRVFIFIIKRRRRGKSCM
jgi:hypothetical protein